MVNGMPVQWICKKQTAVALSTMEAELVSASKAIRELLGLQEQLKELKIDMEKPSILWMDNKAAIVHGQSESSSNRSKHIDIKVKFICDEAKKNKIVMQHVASEDMIADLFTKPLCKEKLVKLRMLCGLSA
jgi:hypothetical protein